MNIFVLHPNPAICASYHCDQHLHKMILESAQMLSVAMLQWAPATKGLYKPTHINHPCTLWTCESFANAMWLVSLCEELDKLRISLGSGSHKSMAIVRKCREAIQHAAKRGNVSPFVFCGPDDIKNVKGSVTDKYKLLYKHKQKEWANTNRPMTFNNRATPSFLL